jgi:hypothetical protein
MAANAVPAGVLFGQFAVERHSLGNGLQGKRLVVQRLRHMRHRLQLAGEHVAEHRPLCGNSPGEGELILQLPVRVLRTPGLHQAYRIGLTADEDDQENEEGRDRAGQPTPPSSTAPTAGIKIRTLFLRLQRGGHTVSL